MSVPPEVRMPTSYQLKVTPQGLRPPIWRRLQVAPGTSLRDLPHLIQAAMGWHHAHLHEFEIGGLRYSAPDPLETMDAFSEEIASALYGGAPRLPPEDRGGVWGYPELAELMADPKHPEHEFMRDWLGRPLEPDAFDLDTVNRRITGVPTMVALFDAFGR